ncbi:MAG: tail fiber domain-containing protein [Ferruginibacter sp.]
MKKLIELLAMALVTINVNAQGVGIGTATPKAAFNVAENKTVLFGRDTSGGGSKLMWIPSKLAFRAGHIGGNLPGYSQALEDSTIWDADSIGLISFATGYQNRATQTGTIAMGTYNKSIGYHSTTIGRSNTSSGSFANSIGLGNQALADYAVCIGINNSATDDASLAIGFGNESVGHYSTALGNYHIAAGNYSTAIGMGNVTNSFASIAIGKNNDTIAGSNKSSWVSTDPLFIIGNGISTTTRSNAMMILKNGKTGFGTNTPAGLLHIKHNGQAANPQLVLEEAQNDYSRISFKNANPGYWNIEAYSKPILGNNDVAKLNFYYSANGYIFSLSGNGNATLTGTLFQNSDERLKKNITPLKNTLSKISQLNAYTYQWKDTARGNEDQLGLLAQEVEKQFPQLVMTDGDGKKSVAYGNMVPILLQAVKEQQQQIDELKKLVSQKLK